MWSMQPLQTAPPGEIVSLRGPAPHTLAVRSPDMVGRLIAAWLLSKRSTNTREAYRRDLLAFFAWVTEWRDQLGTDDPLQLGRWHLDAYREYLTNEEQRTRYHGTRKYSAATVARKLTVISSFYAYCVEEVPHLVPVNPMRRVERPEVAIDSHTGSLSLDEARALMNAARESGPMTHALVGLLLTTGMRISELVKVDTGDLDVEDGVRIVWVQRKGGRKAKLVVPVEIARAVDRYRRGRRGPLFVGATRQRLRRQQVDRVLRRLALDAGYVDVSGKVRTLTPHMLRHTAATLALDAGRDLVDVQEMLGHRDPKTTRRYIANRDRLHRSAVHTVAGLLGADVDPGDVEA
jgi:integrase/recombinase XerD